MKARLLILGIAGVFLVFVAFVLIKPADDPHDTTIGKTEIPRHPARAWEEFRSLFAASSCDSRKTFTQSLRAALVQPGDLKKVDSYEAIVLKLETSAGKAPTIAGIDSSKLHDWYVISDDLTYRLFNLGIELRKILKDGGATDWVSDDLFRLSRLARDETERIASVIYLQTGIEDTPGRERSDHLINKIRRMATTPPSAEEERLMDWADKIRQAEPATQK